MTKERGAPGPDPEPLPDLSPRHAWQLGQCSREAEATLYAHRRQLLPELTALGWSQRKLARLFGVSPQLMACWLRSEHLRPESSLTR